ncbi:hypothetical protein L208DRAFT_1418447, partial [Tricholoma matsutake]
MKLKNNICHLNTKDLVVVVFFVVPSSLHHCCSVVHPDRRGSQQWCGGVVVVRSFGPRRPVVVQYLKKFVPSWFLLLSSPAHRPSLLPV